MAGTLVGTTEVEPWHKPNSKADSMP